MLKWLVRRPPAAPPEVVTDDPLATLKVHKDITQVYAVSRVNPLYEDEECVDGVPGEESGTRGSPEEAGEGGARGDRSSLRSSGYGSKETDSASDGEDEEVGRRRRREEEGGVRVGEVLRARSKAVASIIVKDPNFSKQEKRRRREEENVRIGKDEDGVRNEVLRLGDKVVGSVISRDPTFVQHIEVGLRRSRSLEALPRPRPPGIAKASTVPRPVWPRTPICPQSPLEWSSPRNLIWQDPRFVTSISAASTRDTSCPDSPPMALAPRPPLQGIQVGPNAPGTSWQGFGGKIEVPNVPGPDSLVSEDTLRLMALPGDEPSYENPRPLSMRHSAPPQPSFTRRPAPRGLSSSLSRAPPRVGLNWVAPTAKQRSRSVDGPPLQSKKSRGGGVWAVMDLWERSGLKTNGRKLLVSRDLTEWHQKDYEDVVFSPPSLNGPGVDNPAFEGDGDAAEGISRRENHRAATLDRQRPDFERRVRERLQGDSQRSRGDIEAGNTKGTILDPQKLADFERRVTERLQGAPSHRTAWLNHTNTSTGAKIGRRVTFTSDTRSSPVRNPLRVSPIPGSARKLPLGLRSGGGSVRLSPAPLEHERPIWATPNSADTPSGTTESHTQVASAAIRSTQPAHHHYGSFSSRESSLLRPHPNARAPMCGNTTCHDFTLDLGRSQKLRRLTQARRRRRRLCLALVLLAALIGFVAVIVAVSLYYTQGKRYFGPV